MISPLKNPNREKSGDMTSTRIDIVSLKTFIRNCAGKAHKGKRVQYDVYIGNLQEETPPETCNTL